jgi:GNAT superfamily N-acetyltransferase
LRTGERLTIRPATRVDATDVAAFLNTLSEDSRWLRYHSAMPVIRSWMVWAITDIDHDGREALLAFSGHRIVGIAEWARDLEDSSDAHVAIVVDEGHRRRGIAQALLRQLAEMATHHGYDRFLASVLTVNRPVFGLIERMAPARSSTFNGDTVEVVIPLGPNGAHPDARATA